MYELQNINQNLIKKFYEATKKSKEHKNWYSIIFVSINNTLHEMLPELPKYVTNRYVQEFMKPILDIKDYDISIRNFADKYEAIEAYNNTYKELIEECENSNDIVDKDNLVLIDYIYELLEYDRVIIVDNEKSLYSFTYLSEIYMQYKDAYDKLESNKQNNKSEKAINTSSNTATGYKNKVKFINEYLEPYISHPNIESKKEETQLKFIKEYDEHHHIMARAIHSVSKIKDIPENSITNIIGGLAPWIDSDGKITKNDFYVSWYASIFLLYANSNMPIKKKLELARLSSYVVFPHLKKTKKTITPNKNKSSSKKYMIKDETIVEYQISQNSTTKPIREKSFFEGLRLYDFSDGRFKITKTKDEIDQTEEYLRIITKHLNKLS
ncbi:hypothetical protein [Sulfurimonas sp.]|uniref:hypothetical protein n=1 Tax=Sulfurimonas sp. TaxID=2022749 RepID=UPI0025F34DC0|nr:hypothetical protein [Sulfurimonas sp.]